MLPSCSLLKKQELSENLTKLTEEPVAPEDANEIINESAKNWFYGNGIGNTTVKVGTAIAFPPYALVLLGNAALNIAGYESIGPEQLLPEKAASKVNQVYTSITNAPGIITSKISGNEFRSREEGQEIINNKIKEIIDRREDPTDFMDV